jgi:enoyl-CoA hydratase
MDEMDVEISWPTEQVAQITLNQPERLNALDVSMVDGIRDSLLSLGADERCRVIVLTGAGRGFCAGMNIKASVERDDASSAPASVADRLTGQERFASMIRAARGIRQPVIAAVNGAAAGAGFALTLACDVRLASESASFHVAAVKIGLSAGECGISYHLPRAIGTARAFEVMLTGRPIRAEEAERIGLVSQVVAQDQVVPTALEVAEAICANSPFAIWQTKQIMWQNLAASFDQAIELENRTQILAVGTDDFAEATRAFVEKRPPVFRGR